MAKYRYQYEIGVDGGNLTGEVEFDHEADEAEVFDAAIEDTLSSIAFAKLREWSKA